MNYSSTAMRCLLGLGVAMTMFAGAVSAEPGISKDKVVIGSYLPLQGGLAAGANQLRDGADAYFRSVNDAGGVHGRMIDWRVENDSYNPQQTIAVSKKLVDRDGVFAIVSTLGTATNLAVLPYLVQRGVPAINLAGGHELLNTPKDRNVFGLFPLGTRQGQAMAEYAADTLKAQRVAIFFQNDQFGKDPRDGAAALLQSRNIKIVGEASYLPSDVDLSAQAIALRDANPDVVILSCITKHGALLLKEAEKLGWKPKFVANNTMGDPITHELAGSALEGVIVTLFTATASMDNPLVKQANEILKKYHPKTDPGYWAYLGYAGAVTFTEGLRRAGPDVTREKLILALETLKDFQTGVVPPMTFGPGDHAGGDQFGYAIWQGGKLVVTKGW